MFSRVLVPLDSTPLSDKVLAAAFRCADAEAELLVLRVRADPASLESNSEARAALDQVEAETDATLQRVITAARDQGSSAAIKAEVRSGPLGGTILEAAEEFEADLIVMGTHGRKSLADQLLGSVTEQVAAKAAASVFVVKAAGYPFLQD